MANSRQTGAASTSTESEYFVADAGRRLGPYSTLAPALAFLSCVLYSCNGELLQFLQHHAEDGGHASPMLNLIFCHMGGLIFVPHFLFWKPEGSTASMGMNVKVGSLLLSLLLMGYNYAWLLSARFLAVGLTNAIFQTSIAFVYLASVAIFSEKLESMALVGVCFALCGSFLASGFQNADAPASQNIHAGIFLALFAAFGCMVYQVFFKHFFGHFKNDARFLAHIGAWVSIWHIVLILPLAGLANIVGFEAMQFPHGHLAVGGTLASACIASAVNAMYICMVMWGSIMLLPCASALSVPFTVGLDMLLHHIMPGKLEMMGHMMVVMSVVLIMGLHRPILLHLRPKLCGGATLP